MIGFTDSLKSLRENTNSLSVKDTCDRAINQFEKIKEINYLQNMNPVKNHASFINESDLDNIRKNNIYKIEKERLHISLLESTIQELRNINEKESDENIDYFLNIHSPKLKVTNLGIKEAISKILESELMSHTQAKYIIHNFQVNEMNGPEFMYVDKFFNTFRQFNWLPIVKESLDNIQKVITENKEDFLVYRTMYILENSKTAYIAEMLNEDIKDYLGKRNTLSKRALLDKLEKFTFESNIMNLYNTLKEGKGLSVTSTNDVSVKNLYSPILLIEEGEIFGIGMNFYIKKGNTISKLDEQSVAKLEDNFKLVSNILIQENVSVDSAGITIYLNDRKVQIGNGGELKLNENSINKDNFRKTFLNTSSFDRNSTRQLSLIETLHNNIDNIVELDFAKRLTSTKIKNRYVDIFKLDETISIFKNDPHMGTQEFLKDLNGLQAKSLVMEFMNYDITNAFSEMIDADTKKLKEVNETKQMYIKAINKLEEKLNKIQNINDKDISESSSYKNLVDIVENEISQLKEEYNSYVKVAFKMSNINESNKNENKLVSTISNIDEYEINSEIESELQALVENFNYNLEIEDKNLSESYVFAYLINPIKAASINKNYKKLAGAKVEKGMEKVLVKRKIKAMDKKGMEASKKKEAKEKLEDASAVRTKSLDDLISSLGERMDNLAKGNDRLKAFADALKIKSDLVSSQKLLKSADKEELKVLGTDIDLRIKKLKDKIRDKEELFKDYEKDMKDKVSDEEYQKAKEQSAQKDNTTGDPEPQEKTTTGDPEPQEKTDNTEEELKKKKAELEKKKEELKKKFEDLNTKLQDLNSKKEKNEVTEEEYNKQKEEIDKEKNDLDTEANKLKDEEKNLTSGTSESVNFISYRNKVNEVTGNRDNKDNYHKVIEQLIGKEVDIYHDDAKDYAYKLVGGNKWHTISKEEVDNLVETMVTEGSVEIKVNGQTIEINDKEDSKDKEKKDDKDDKEKEKEDDKEKEEKEKITKDDDEIVSPFENLEDEDIKDKKDTSENKEKNEKGNKKKKIEDVSEDKEKEDKEKEDKEKEDKENEDKENEDPSDLTPGDTVKTADKKLAKVINVSSTDNSVQVFYNDGTTERFTPDKLVIVNTIDKKLDESYITYILNEAKRINSTKPEKKFEKNISEKLSDKKKSQILDELEKRITDSDNYKAISEWNDFIDELSKAKNIKDWNDVVKVFDEAEAFAKKIIYKYNL